VDGINLSITANQMEFTQLQLIDLSGKEVANTHFNLQEGVNKFSWNGLSKIQAGIYFLKITGTTHTEIIKLIKQ